MADADPRSKNNVDNRVVVHLGDGDAIGTAIDCMAS